MTCGVILAGGASTRMGRPKAALTIGSRGHTVLSLGVQTLLRSGIPRIIVVAGAVGSLQLREWLGPRRGSVCVIDNPRWEQGQLTSLVAGLDAVDGPSLEAVLVTLVDVPLVAPETVRQIIHAWRVTRAPIVRPAIGERHGHPVMFDRSVFEALRRADPAVGAKEVVNAYAGRIVNVPVSDEGAFADLDTLEDYERVLKDSFLAEGLWG